MFALKRKKFIEAMRNLIVDILLEAEEADQPIEQPAMPSVSRAKQLLMQTPWSYQIKQDERGFWNIEFTYNGKSVGNLGGASGREEAEMEAQKELALFQELEATLPFNLNRWGYIWAWVWAANDLKTRLAFDQEHQELPN